MSIISCSLCKKSFNKKPSQIALSRNHYCSLNCGRQAQRNGRVVFCYVCKTKVYKPLKALSNSKSGHYFCTKSCQTKWRNSYFSGSKHSNYKEGRYSYRTILVRNHIPQICNLCKTQDKRVLAVHHIDLNHSNNHLENLAWLCHNCHFLVHHDKLEKQRFLSILET